MEFLIDDRVRVGEEEKCDEVVMREEVETGRWGVLARRGGRKDRYVDEVSNAGEEYRKERRGERKGEGFDPETLGRYVPEATTVNEIPIYGRQREAIRRKFNRKEKKNT